MVVFPHHFDRLSASAQTHPPSGDGMVRVREELFLYTVRPLGREITEGKKEKKS